jgi:hypothetical protein
VSIELPCILLKTAAYSSVSNYCKHILNACKLCGNDLQIAFLYFHVIEWVSTINWSSSSFVALLAFLKTVSLAESCNVRVSSHCHTPPRTPLCCRGYMDVSNYFIYLFSYCIPSWTTCSKIFCFSAQDNLSFTQDKSLFKAVPYNTNW